MNAIAHSAHFLFRPQEILPELSPSPKSMSSTVSGTYNYSEYENTSRAFFAKKIAVTPLEAIKTRQENWDGHNSAAPLIHSVIKAEETLNKLFEASLKASLAWSQPFISSDEDGVVTLEWWNHKKKVTIYAQSTASEFIKVWGANIDDEMEDGELTDQNLLQVWRWLMA